MVDSGAAVYCVLGLEIFNKLSAEGLVYDVRGKEANVRLQSLTRDSLGYRHTASLVCPTKNGAFQIKEAYVCEGVPPYTAILGRQALDEMKAMIDFADGEVTVRLPFTNPGALERAMQSQCGDGATPDEVAEMQSKLEWFTHFSARQLDKPLVLTGATLQQIRSVMVTLRVETQVPESTDVSDGPVMTAPHGDCQTEGEHSRAV